MEITDRFLSNDRSNMLRQESGLNKHFKKLRKKKKGKKEKLLHLDSTRLIRVLRIYEMELFQFHWRGTRSSGCI